MAVGCMRRDSRRMTRQVITKALGLTACLWAAAAVAPAQAADGMVSVELNKLEATNNACRAYLVLQNGTSHAFESLKLDVVMFDADGIVARRLAVEAAPLSTGKTSLKVFDVDGLACTEVGRVLLNDVLTCTGDGGALDGCIDMIEPASRTDAPFVK